MKVKNIIISALRLLGRSEQAAALGAGEEVTESGLIDTLLYCFNAVEDELARRYVPLNASDSLKSSTGKYSYLIFSHTPARIKRVYAGGERADFSVYPLYMAVNSPEICVEYEYSPRKKTIDEESDFDGGVGEYLVALGIAAEYCLINGEIEAADQWEKKYRAEIDGAQRRLPVCREIPPRRWV